MLVRDCLPKSPITVPPQCSLEEAGRLMKHHDVGALIVISADEVLGIVTDRDIVIRGIGASQTPGTWSMES